MSDTDVPPPTWGAIDTSALTSKMPVVAYNPMHIDRVPGPVKSIVPIAELMDQKALDDAFAPMQGALARLTRKLIDDEEQAVMALRARAEETGDQRGVEVVHRSHSDGDTIRFKMTATLSDEVPFGLIVRRWEFEPCGPCNAASAQPAS